MARATHRSHDKHTQRIEGLGHRRHRWDRARHRAALPARVPRSQHGRNSQRGAETVKDIENAGGKARFIAADLSEADDVRRLATEAGAVDILVNNGLLRRSLVV